MVKFFTESTMIALSNYVVNTMINAMNSTKYIMHNVNVSDTMCKNY